MAKTKRKDVLLLQQSIERTVRLLTGLNIPVYQRGKQAYVSWKDASKSVPAYVNIPVIHDTASQKFIDAIQGFIDHEVAHVLYTDASWVEKGWDTCQNEQQGTEDCFIEWRTVQDHPGAASNLRRTRHLMIKEIINPLWIQHGESMSLFERWGLLYVCAMRAWSGQPEFVEYMEDKWEHIQDVVDELGPLTGRFPPKSSEEAYYLALDINKALYKEAPKVPPTQSGDGDEDEDKDDDECDSGEDSSDTGGQDDGAEGDSAEADEDGEIEDNESDDAGASGEGDEDGEESDPGDTGRSDDDGTEGDESTEADDEGDEDEADGDSGDDGESEGDEEPEDNSGRGGDSAEGADAEDCSDEPDDSGEPSDSGEEADSDDDADGSSTEGEPSGESPDDVEGEADVGDGDFEQAEREPIFGDEEPGEENEDDHMAKLLEAIATEEHSGTKYVPYTRIYDTLERHKYVDSDRLRDTMRQMQDRVDEVSGGLRRHLQRMFESMNRDRWEAGKHQGKLDGANLQRLKTNDPRVFKQKHITRTKKTAVSLVVDCSGSMSGNKIVAAMMTAWAFAEVLDKMGINFEVIGFTTSYDTKASEELREAQNEHGPRGSGEFVRFEPIHMPIFKDWNEKYDTDKKLRMASYPRSGGLSQNIDGESVKYAADRLMRQREENKVMIVLSDGSPACGTVHPHDLSSHLIDVIAEVEKDGINVVGIGIQDKSVKRYYRKHVLINDLKDLPGKVIRELGKLVLTR